MIQLNTEASSTGTPMAELLRLWTDMTTVWKWLAIILFNNVEFIQSELFVSQLYVLQSVNCWAHPHYKHAVSYVNVVLNRWLSRFVQESSNSIANTLELLQSCTKPSK